MSDKEKAILGIKKLRWLCLMSPDTRLVSKLVNVTKLTICIWRLKFCRSGPVSMWDDVQSTVTVIYILLATCTIVALLVNVFTMLGAL